MFLLQGRDYKCRWCNKLFKGDKTNTSYFNLRGHRDGSSTRPVCNQRHKAIAAGLPLPPSYTDKQQSKEKINKATLSSFISGPPFTVELLNMLLVLWIIRHALPWARFEDPALRAAFNSVNRGAIVRSRTWAAQKSVLLYSALHHKAITTVKVSRSVFITSPLPFTVYLYLNTDDDWVQTPDLIRIIKADSVWYTTCGPQKATGMPSSERQLTTSMRIGLTDQLTWRSRWSHGDILGPSWPDQLVGSWYKMVFTRRWVSTT